LPTVKPLFPTGRVERHWPPSVGASQPARIAHYSVTKYNAPSALGHAVSMICSE
jgi:hypothetical protein